MEQSAVIEVVDRDGNVEWRCPTPEALPRQLAAASDGDGEAVACGRAAETAA